MTTLHLEWGKLYPCIDSEGKLFVGSEWNYFFTKGYGDNEVYLYREIIVPGDERVLSEITFIKVTGKSGQTGWTRSNWMNANDRLAISEEFNDALFVIHGVLLGKRECDFEFSNALQDLLNRHGSIA